MNPRWRRAIGHHRKISAYIAYPDTRSNTVTWLKIDVKASNGVIHVVDSVIQGAVPGE